MEGAHRRAAHAEEIDPGGFVHRLSAKKERRPAHSTGKPMQGTPLSEARTYSPAGRCIQDGSPLIRWRNIRQGLCHARGIGLKALVRMVLNDSCTARAHALHDMFRCRRAQ
jgi:hypothetical protein